MKKIFFVLVAVAVLFLMPINSIIVAQSVPVKAPGIALEDINGNFILLSSILSNNNVVLSFWSYDCAPCRVEMPELQQMAETGLFKEKNLKLIFIYVEATTEKSGSDADRPPKEKAFEVLQKLNIKAQCLLDIYGVVFNNYREANKIKKSAMPLLFLVNKKKNIVFSATGYSEKNLKYLEKAVKNDL